MPQLTKRNALIAAVVATAIGLGAFFVLQDEKSGGAGNVDVAAVAPEEGDSVTESLVGGPEELLYLNGGSLKLRDLESNADEEVAELPTNEVTAARGSTTVAFVEGEVQDVGSSAVIPMLNILDSDSPDDVTSVGIGYSPLWSPTGSAVAYIRPLELDTCSAVLCSGDGEVVVHDPADGDEGTVLTGEKYTLLAWAGDRLLVARRDLTEMTLSVGLDGEFVELDVPPNEVLSAAPDGRWLILKRSDELVFQELDGERLGDERKTLEVGEDEFLSVEWAPNSRQVALLRSTPLSAGSEATAPLVKEAARLLGLKPARVQRLLDSSPNKLRRLYRDLRESKPDKAERLIVLAQEYLNLRETADSATSIEVIAPEDLEPALIDESFSAIGRVLWSADGESLVFSRLVDARSGRKQTKVCAVAPEGSCEAIFTWDDNIVLLRTQ